MYVDVWPTDSTNQPWAMVWRSVYPCIIVTPDASLSWVFDLGFYVKTRLQNLKGGRRKRGEEENRCGYQRLSPDRTRLPLRNPATMYHKVKDSTGFYNINL